MAFSSVDGLNSTSHDTNYAIGVSYIAISSGLTFLFCILSILVPFVSSYLYRSICMQNVCSGTFWKKIQDCFRNDFVERKICFQYLELPPNILGLRIGRKTGLFFLLFLRVVEGIIFWLCSVVTARSEISGENFVAFFLDFSNSHVYLAPLNSIFLIIISMLYIIFGIHKEYYKSSKRRNISSDEVYREIIPITKSDDSDLFNLDFTKDRKKSRKKRSKRSRSKRSRSKRKKKSREKQRSRNPIGGKKKRTKSKRKRKDRRKKGKKKKRKSSRSGLSDLFSTADLESENGEETSFLTTMESSDKSLGYSRSSDVEVYPSLTVLTTLCRYHHYLNSLTVTSTFYNTLVFWIILYPFQNNENTEIGWNVLYSHGVITILIFFSSFLLPKRLGFSVVHHSLPFLLFCSFHLMIASFFQVFGYHGFSYSFLDFDENSTSVLYHCLNILCFLVFFWIIVFLSSLKTRIFEVFQFRRFSQLKVFVDPSLKMTKNERKRKLKRTTRIIQDNRNVISDSELDEELRTFNTISRNIEIGVSDTDIDTSEDIIPHNFEDNRNGDDGELYLENDHFKSNVVEDSDSSDSSDSEEGVEGEGEFSDKI